MGSDVVADRRHEGLCWAEIKNNPMEHDFDIFDFGAQPDGKTLTQVRQLRG